MAGQRRPKVCEQLPTRAQLAFRCTKHKKTGGDSQTQVGHMTVIRGGDGATGQMDRQKDRKIPEDESEDS